MGFRTMTHPSEIPVDDVAGVEVIARSSAIPDNLEVRKRCPIREKGDTNKSEPVHARVISDIFLQSPPQ